MAWALKSMGYSDVTILEKSNRIGGKSATYEAKGTKQILTTVFWTNDYNQTMVPLFKQFGMLDDDAYAPIDSLNLMNYPNNDDSVSFKKRGSNLYTYLVV